jgi:hypothetical protein
MRNAMVRWLKRGSVLSVVFAFAGTSHAQNLLVNGDLEASAAGTYFDGSDPAVADDIPGWISTIGTAGSYTLLLDSGGGNNLIDYSGGTTGTGIETNPINRPAVTGGLEYTASMTWDNYFAPSATSLFIDWFDSGGSLISSNGGAAPDNNSPAVFAPTTQLFSFNAFAPATATAAGVRLDAFASFQGAEADNFSFSAVPEPGSASLLSIGALLALKRRQRA